MRAHFEHKDLKLMYGENYEVKRDLNGILKIIKLYLHHGGSVSMLGYSYKQMRCDFSSTDEGLDRKRIFCACIDRFAQSC